MSEIFARIRALVSAGDFVISDHAYRQAQAREIIIEHLAAAVAIAEVVEDYPDFHKGPAVLVLSRVDGRDLHMVWGIPKALVRPAWLVTAYVPDPLEWFPDTKTRRT